MFVTLVLAGLAAASAASAYVPGTQLWVRTLGTDRHYVDGKAMAVRADGVVYLAGGRGDHGGEDVLVTQYDATGARRWTAIWAGPVSADSATAIAVSPQGGAYVAGTGDGVLLSKDDILLQKYSAAGKRAWTRRYNGPAGRDDAAHELVVDGAGDVYIVGDSAVNFWVQGAVVLKYSASGALCWVQRLDPDLADPLSASTYGEDIALDGNGDVYVCASSVYAGLSRGFVVKYAGSDGAELARSGSIVILGTETEAKAIAIRGAEVVLAGWYHAWDEPNAFRREMLVQRFDLNLTSEWSAMAAGDAAGRSSCTDVAIDAAGNVYAAGYTYQQVGAEARRRATLLKVTPGGDLAWKRTYVPGTKSESSADKVALAGGNAYVTGSSEGDTEKHDFLTLRYSSAGARRWAKQWRGTGHGYDTPSDLGIGPGCVYVGGHGLWGSGWGVGVLVKYAR